LDFSFTLFRAEKLSLWPHGPPVELVYPDGNLLVSAELPGLTEDDVDVQIGAMIGSVLLWAHAILTMGGSSNTLWRQYHRFTSL
jgi:hypothetical protein